MPVYVFLYSIDDRYFLVFTREALNEKTAGLLTPPKRWLTRLMTSQDSLYFGRSTSIFRRVFRRYSFLQHLFFYDCLSMFLSLIFLFLCFHILSFTPERTWSMLNSCRMTTTLVSLDSIRWSQERADSVHFYSGRRRTIDEKQRLDRSYLR